MTAYWQWGKTQTRLFGSQQEQPAQRQQRQQRDAGVRVHISQVAVPSRIARWVRLPCRGEKWRGFVLAALLASGLSRANNNGRVASVRPCGAALLFARDL